MVIVTICARFRDLNDAVATFGCSDEGSFDLASGFSTTAGAFGITSQKRPILQLDDVFASKACPHIIFCLLYTSDAADE